jgi:hypothetical protein
LSIDLIYIAWIPAIREKNLSQKLPIDLAVGLELRERVREHVSGIHPYP